MGGLPKPLTPEGLDVGPISPDGRTIVAIAALPLAALLAGALTFLLTDYPHFLLHDARARTGIPEGPVTTRAPVVR